MCVCVCVCVCVCASVCARMCVKFDTVFGSNEGLEAWRHICCKKWLFWADTINTMVAAGQKCIYSVCMCVFMKPLVMLHMSSSKGQWKGGVWCVCLCVCVGCVRLNVYWGCEVEWPTDPNDWLFMPLKYDMDTHTEKRRIWMWIDKEQTRQREWAVYSHKQGHVNNKVWP